MRRRLVFFFRHELALLCIENKPMPQHPHSRRAGSESAHTTSLFQASTAYTVWHGPPSFTQVCRCNPHQSPGPRSKVSLDTSHTFVTTTTGRVCAATGCTVPRATKQCQRWHLPSWGTLAGREMATPAAAFKLNDLSRCLDQLVCRYRTGTSYKLTWLCLQK